MALAALVLFPAAVNAQSAATTTQQYIPPTAANAAQGDAAKSSQAIPRTGLLPLFAVDMQFDPSWVDGASAPSKSTQYSHNGVNDTFQQAWDALKPAGFNMIRFPIDVADSQTVARTVNLCIWAKANNVSLVPILKSTGPSGKNTSTIVNDVSAFISAFLSRIRQGDASQFSAYTQIAYYQIEDTMNHAGLYPGMSAETAHQTLLGASEALRKSETQALQGTGVQATPILIGASFDFELIRQGAIAGVPLDAAAEQKAQASLAQFLSVFSTAVNIDAVIVEWFPRSVSSGDVDHFSTLLRELKASLPAKQLLLTTGFSSAFNPVDQQAQFYTLAVSNLGDFRASDGVDSKFLGVVFRQAFRGSNADAKPPASSSDPSRWDWSAKAKQLNEMWLQGRKSDELEWWLKKVQDNMGLLSLQPNGSGGISVVSLPAQQSFQQISTTVAQVSQNVATPAYVPYGASFSPQTAAPAVSQSPAPPFQQAMFTIVQQFTTQMTTNLAARLTGSNGSGLQSGAYPAANFGIDPQSQNNPYGQYGTINNGSSPGGLPSSYASNPPPGNGDPGLIPNTPLSDPYRAQAPQTVSPQPGQATSPGVQSSATRVQPQINFFGPMGANSPAVGQIPPISLQVANPTNGYMQSAQAQLFVDGTFSQTLALGPLVPKQTKSAVFADIPAASGPHAIRVVVTTADGGTASATSSVNSTPSTLAASASATSTNSNANQGAITSSSTGIPVRPGTPTNFSIGSVSQSMTIPSSNGIPTRPGPAGVSGASPPTSAAAPARTITQVPTGTNAGGLLPQRPGGMGMTANPPTSGPMRPVATGAETTVNPPNANLPKRPGPTGAYAGPAPPATIAPVTPGTTVAAPQTSGGMPARPGPGGMALTPTPPPAPASSATGAITSATARGDLNLSVSVPDIHFSPAAYRPGQSVTSTTFTAVIHNNGISGAQVGNVVFTLFAGEHQLAVQQLPVNIVARGTFQASWTYTTPSVRNCIWLSPSSRTASRI
jgi:hypothetical protein